MPALGARRNTDEFRDEAVEPAGQALGDLVRQVGQAAGALRRLRPSWPPDDGGFRLGDDAVQGIAGGALTWPPDVLLTWSPGLHPTSLQVMNVS